MKNLREEHILLQANDQLKTASKERRELVSGLRSLVSVVLPEAYHHSVPSNLILTEFKEMVERLYKTNISEDLLHLVVTDAIPKATRDVLDSFKLSCKNEKTARSSILQKMKSLEKQGNRKRRK